MDLTREYWRQEVNDYINDYLSNNMRDDESGLSEQERKEAIDAIVGCMLNDDDLWGEIDNYIFSYAFREGLI